LFPEEKRNGSAKKNKPSAKSIIINQKHSEAREILIGLQLELEFMKSFTPSENNVAVTEKEINLRIKEYEGHCEYWLAKLNYFKGLKQARLDNLALGAFKYAPDKIIIKGDSCFCEDNSAKTTKP